MVEDLGSTNGTFVDAKRIERAELHSGDRVHIGPNVILSFAIVAAQAEHVAQQLYESSVRDPLTRIFNRRYLVERLASEVAYAKRHGTKLSLILFDLDLFKRVNDTYGHLVGDDVLRDVSALVQRLVRAEDVFARFGGEEFVLLVRGIEHVNVGRFAERVRSAVERLEIAAEALVLNVTVSLGYASIERASPRPSATPTASWASRTSASTRPRPPGETASAALDARTESRFTSGPLAPGEHPSGGISMAVDIKQLFNETLPAALTKNAEEAKTIGAKFQLNITGPTGGEWNIDVSATGPVCKAGTGDADCTISITDEDFQKLVENPQANGMQLFFAGKLKVSGNQMLAMKLQKLFSFQ